jgi:outer membrane lipoprotein SlyB
MKKTVMLIILSAILSGCSNSDIYSGDVYTTDQAKQVQQVSYGTVVAVRAVKIQANSDGQNNGNFAGPAGGAIIGGVLGNTIGNGTGRILAAATGAIGGAILGDAVENKSSQVAAVELEVKQDNGSTIVIVQKGDAKQFYAGQKVKLISNGKRISAAPKYSAR